ncbi:uncharacterized protein LTR77_005316 [Saxophila tyrrhenica]|uniref:Uncharacterized protein n=1 Tax=Saxophila tyrrhenica TaxID=1690608 RepID=A0AAV9PAC0_9PEZI|nr:hypothetical protein LTR77_005316 [Saxophila tyrrhenica]
MANAPQLSTNDLSVLSAIFDPEGTPSEIPYQPCSFASSTVADTEEPSESAIRTTIAALDDLLDEYPRYASAYNNRAQARRMLERCGDARYSAEDTRLILDDLDVAIRLASQNNTSAKEAKVLAAAHTHRGHLLYRASKDQSLAGPLSATNGRSISDSGTLEEEASKEFALGGRYGNKIAKQMAVQTNPYAKLCGQMVKRALNKEYQECSS